MDHFTRELSPEWLLSEYWTPEQIESFYTQPGGKPFGASNEAWEEFKKQLLPGERIQTFCLPREQWKDPMGCVGWCIVRDGKIVYHLSLDVDPKVVL